MPRESYIELDETTADNLLCFLIMEYVETGDEQALELARSLEDENGDHPPVDELVAAVREAHERGVVMNIQTERMPEASTTMRCSDSSFMRMESLYRASSQAIVECCRRFGADNADTVLAVARYLAASGMNTVEERAETMLRETGIVLSKDDHEFLEAFVRAEEHVRRAAALLDSACKIPASADGRA